MAKKAEPIFGGFTPKAIQFFNDLKENNYKEWFEEHRSIYENEVFMPMKALVTAMSPAMSSIDPEFELRPHRAVSRIYRDVRFSKNKDPYKTCMWLSFQKPVSREEWTGLPGYFMEISGESYIYGMGLFMPKKKTMDAFRDEVSYDAAEFQKVTQKTVLDRGFELGGEEYKRKLISDLPEYFQPWIQRKGVWVFKKKPIGEEVYSADFATQIADDFKALEWLYNFMKEVTL